MLLSSYFILNKYVRWTCSYGFFLILCLPVFLSLGRTDEINKHTFYPYVHSFSNVVNKQSILRAISIPDVLPSDLPRGSNFSLVAGMFWRANFFCDSLLSGCRWLRRNLWIGGTFRWTTIRTMGCDHDLLFHWHREPSLFTFISHNLNCLISG